MRIVSQNVSNANIVVRGEEIAKINKGILFLVSFTDGDNEEIVDKMVYKILNLRIFQDEHGKTNLSIFDINGEVLSVSQFTLYASVKEGRRPSFTNCLNYSQARRLYDYFNEKIRLSGLNLQRGIFGEDMDVRFTNNGPFTLILDSEEIIK